MRPPLTLRVHALLERSYANGPGCRAVVWVQGCSLRCDGCCNPGAQDPDGGHPVPVANLLARVRSIEGIEGITLSGGEPLQQAEAVGELLQEVRSTTGLSVVLFTGYAWDRVNRQPDLATVAGLADIVVAGPFVQGLRLERGLRGSSNQTVHLLTDRYTLADLEAVPEVEVVLHDDATVVTGIAVPDP
ncbi:MAG: radical SAM protein [Deltaproteobacteria bacterium]|nr:radical SAM protein [Deltaproteobacteria bacterium]